MTAPALAIRPGHSDDADAMARLVHAGFAGYESFAPDWAWPRGAEEEADELRTRLGDDATWSAVAENGGEAIAFVLVVPARTSWRAPAGRRHRASALAVRGRGVPGNRAGVAAAGARRRCGGGARLRVHAPLHPGRRARACRFYEREAWTAAGEPFSSDFGLPLLEYRRLLQ